MIEVHIIEIPPKEPLAEFFGTITLSVMPRIGEKIEIDSDGQKRLLKVVDIHHAVDAAMPDIYVSTF